MIRDVSFDFASEGFGVGGGALKARHGAVPARRKSVQVRRTQRVLKLSSCSCFELVLVFGSGGEGIRGRS